MEMMEVIKVVNVIGAKEDLHDRLPGLPGLGQGRGITVGGMGWDLTLLDVYVGGDNQQLCLPHLALPLSCLIFRTSFP